MSEKESKTSGVGFTPEYQRLETWTRRELRAVIPMNEKGIQTVSARLASLSRAGFEDAEIYRWALWKAQEIKEQPGVSNAAGVLVTAIRGGDPNEMPKTPVKVNPEGHSPDPDYREQMRQAREEVREYEPPMQLVQVLGRRTGDYRAAYYEAAAEHERQGKPAPWEMDLTPFEQEGNGDLDPIKAWQEKRQGEER